MKNYKNILLNPNSTIKEALQVIGRGAMQIALVVDDLLPNINFESMMKYHLSNSAVVTMGVREYDFQVPYGVVNVKNGNILNIEEKPVHKFFVSGRIDEFKKSNNEFYEVFNT